MKKLLALILAATMALTLCACGGSDTSNTPSSLQKQKVRKIRWSSSFICGIRLISA